MKPLRTVSIFLACLALSACGGAGGGAEQTAVTEARPAPDPGGKGDYSGSSGEQGPRASVSANGHKTLFDAVSSALEQKGADAVGKALDSFVSGWFDDATVREAARAQIDGFLSQKGYRPFPVIPLTLLQQARGILESANPGPQELPSAVQFDLAEIQADCTAVRPSLEPLSPALPGLSRGGIPDPSVDDCSLARAQSFARVLNHIALDDGSRVVNGQQSFVSVGEVFDGLVASGHTVWVEPRVHFADFLGLYYEGKSVIAPVWIDTGIRRVSGANLLVPAPHAGLTFHVEGPLLQADIEFFMGTDGGTQFRAVSSVPRAEWQGKRALAHYDSSSDLATTRATLVQAARLRKKWQTQGLSLPNWGYGVLGVCNDSVAVVQLLVEGRGAQLFPLAHAVPSSVEDDIDAALVALPSDLAEPIPPDAAARVRTSFPYSDMAMADTYFPLYAQEIRELDGR